MSQDWRPAQLIGKESDGTLLYSMSVKEPEGLTTDDLDAMAQNQSYIASCCDGEEGVKDSPCKDPKAGKLSVPRYDDSFPGWAGEEWNVPIEPPIGGFKLSNTIGGKKKWFPKRYRYACGYCDQNLVEFTTSGATADKAKGEGWVNPKGKDFVTSHKRTLYWAQEAFYRPTPSGHETLFYGQPGATLIEAHIPDSSKVINPWEPITPPPTSETMPRYQFQVPMPGGKGLIENIPYLITTSETHFVLKEQWVINPETSPGYAFFPLAVPSGEGLRVLYVKLYKYKDYPHTLEEVAIPRAEWVLNGALVFIALEKIDDYVINCFWGNLADIWQGPPNGGYKGASVEDPYVAVLAMSQGSLIDVCRREAPDKDRMVLNVAEPTGQLIYGWNNAWVLDMATTKGQRQLYVLEKAAKPKDSCLCKGQKGLLFRALPKNPYEDTAKFTKDWERWWADWCHNEPGSSSSDKTTVTIYVRSFADMGNATVITWMNQPASITLQAGGMGGSTKYTITVNPSHGKLTGKAPNLVYTPTHDYHGPDSFSYSTDSEGTPEAPALVLYPDHCSAGDELSWVKADGGGFDRIDEFDHIRKLPKITLVRKGAGILKVDTKDYKAKFYHQKEVSGAKPDRVENVKHGWATSEDSFPQIVYKGGWKFLDGYHKWNFSQFVPPDKDGAGGGGLYWTYEGNIDNYGKRQDNFATIREMCCCLGCCDCTSTEFLQNAYQEFSQEQEYVNFRPDFADYPSGKDPSIKGKFTPKSVGMRFKAYIRDTDKSMKTFEFSISLDLVGSCLFYTEGAKSSGSDTAYYCAMLYRKDGYWNYKVRLGNGGGKQYFDAPGSGGNLYEGTLKGLEKYGFETAPCTFDAPQVTHVVKPGTYPKTGKKTKLDIAAGKPSVVANSQLFTGPGGSGKFTDRYDCCGDKDHIPDPHPWLNPITGHMTRVPGEYKKSGKVHYCTCALIRFKGDLVQWTGSDYKGRDKYDKLKEWNWVNVVYENNALVYQIKVCNDEAVIEGTVKLWPQLDADRTLDNRNVMVFYKNGFGVGNGWFRGKYFIKAAEVALTEFTSPYSVKSDCDCEHSVDNSHVVAVLDSTYRFHGGQPGDHPGRYATGDVEANLWYGDAMSFRTIPVYKMDISAPQWLPESLEKDPDSGKIVQEDVRPIWITLGIFSQGDWIFEFKETGMRDKDNKEDKDSVDFIFRVGTAEYSVGTSKHTITISGGTCGIDIRSNKEVRDKDSEGKELDPYYKAISATYYVYKKELGSRSLDLREKYELTVPYIDVEIINPCGKATLGNRNEQAVDCKVLEITNPQDKWPEEFKDGVPVPFEKIRMQYPDPLRLRLEKLDPISADPFATPWASLLNKDIYLKAETKEDDKGIGYVIYKKDYIELGDEFYYTVQFGGVLKVYGITYPRKELYGPWKAASGEDPEIYDPEDWFYAWGVHTVEWDKEDWVRVGLLYEKTSLHIQGYYQGELSFYTFGEIDLVDKTYFMREFKPVTSFGLSVDGSVVLPITKFYTMTYKSPGTFGA